ncbi:hypothetical protein ABEY43_06455 [Priestia megaterium]
MANDYLYTSNDHKTSARKDTDGRPVTDVEIKGARVQDVVLQADATAVGNGTPFQVGAAKTVTVEITGTSTSRTIVFEAASVSGAFYPVQGVKTSTYDMASQTTGKDEVWQIDVTGQVTLRARVSAIAGGNVSVKGKAVS